MNTTASQNSPKEENEVLLSLSDLTRVLKKNKKKILFCSLFFAFITLWMTLNKPLTYTAEASFKEKGKSHTGMGKSFAELLMGSSGEQDSEAVTVMKSRKLTSDLVKRLGLQGIITEKGKSPSRWRRIKHNLRLQYAHLRKRHNEPFIHDSPSAFSIQAIEYNGEFPTTLSLIFTSDEDFTVWDKDKQFLGEGKLGLPFENLLGKFTIVSQTNAPLMKREFFLSLIPLETISEGLSKSFKVGTDKNDKSLIILSFNHQDRQQAKRMLNELMVQYQEYLKEEHDRTADKQMDYLQKRQSEMYEKQVELMEDYALMLAGDLSTSGLADTEREMEFLLGNQQNYTQKLFSIELEMKRLEDISRMDSISSGLTLLGNEVSTIGQVLTSLNELKQQRDTLSLALRQNPQNVHMDVQEGFIKQNADLDHIRKMTDEMYVLVEQIKNNQPLNTSLEVIRDPLLLVGPWTEKLQTALVDWQRAPASQKQARLADWERQKSSCLAYLNNSLRLLDVHSQLLGERLSHEYNPASDFQGIDLSTANHLYMEYSNQASNIEAEIRQNDFILEQIKDPKFEIFSLISVLKDSVSNEIIAKSSALGLLLRDQNNRSTKELERIQAELEVQKEFLRGHLSQTGELLKLREKLYQEKIASIQAVTLELVHQKISILEKHVFDYIDSRIHHLNLERDLIKKQLLDLHQTMAHLPHKWVWEKIIKQNLDMHKSIVEEISKLGEGKNISHHLEMIQSAPVDMAYASVLPNSPRIPMFLVIGAILGGFLSSCYFLLNSVLTGVQASEDNLQLSQQHVSGKLTNRCMQEPFLDTDLSTLRRLYSFLNDEGKRNKVILLLQGEGPQYAESLSKLMYRKGLKVLILNLSFNQETRSEQLQGLLQYMEGKVAFPKIHQGKEFDRIEAGGITRFTSELVGTELFRKLLEKVSTSYDYVLVVSQAAPCSAEADVLISLFDTVVITIVEEKLMDLKPYMKEKEKRITFVIKD